MIFVTSSELPPHARGLKMSAQYGPSQTSFSESKEDDGRKHTDNDTKQKCPDGFTNVQLYLEYETSNLETQTKPTLSRSNKENIPNYDNVS